MVEVSVDSYFLVVDVVEGFMVDDVLSGGDIMYESDMEIIEYDVGKIFRGRRSW